MDANNSNISSFSPSAPPNSPASAPPPVSPPSSAIPAVVSPGPSAVPPPGVITSVSSSSKPTRKNLILIILGVLIFLLFLFVIFFFLIKRPLSSSTPSRTAANPQTTAVESSFPQYKKDSDSDSIPDLVETSLGLNPNQSDILRCQPANCSGSDKTLAGSGKKNILFIIDASGSMGLSISGKSKMDLAKEAIKNFVASAPSAVNIGIMEYGHRGSNSSSDKTVSCSSAELVAPLGTINPQSLDAYLSRIQPVGWTPIGLAITNAQSAFSGQEDSQNQIIIVTDGAETCSTNPTQAAAMVHASPAKIQVDVIGFAVTAADQQSLSEISKNGGGVFSLANNSSELLAKIKSSNENFKSYISDIACINTAYTASTNCLTEVKSQVVKYMLSLTEKTKGKEYSAIYDAENLVSTTFNKEIDRQFSEWNSKKISTQNKLLN